MPIPRTRRARSRPPVRCGRTSTSAPRTRCCPRSASSSVPRPPRSTPICSRWSAPISARLDGALAAAAFRRPVPHRAVERRRHVDRDRAPAAGAHRAVRSGRRRRRRRGDRAGRGLSTTSSPAISAAPRSTSRLSPAARTALAAQTTVDFGLVIRTPMVEITTIGAGGGSIAAVDRGGLLQVGPESAGSVPGPACYGRGQHAADLDRRPGRARPHQCRAADRRRRSARRRGGAGGDRRACRRAARPRRRRRRRRRSCGSPRRAWPAPSVSSRSSAGTIRRNSSPCRSAAAARCTRAR